MIWWRLAMRPTRRRPRSSRRNPSRQSRPRHRATAGAAASRAEAGVKRSRKPRPTRRTRRYSRRDRSEAPRPEPKAEPRPAPVEAEAPKPEPPEPKPEPKAGSQPKPKPEKAETKPAPKPEPKAMARAEPKPEPKTEPRPQAKPKPPVEARAKPESKPAPRPNASRKPRSRSRRKRRRLRPRSRDSAKPEAPKTIQKPEPASDFAAVSKAVRDLKRQQSGREDGPAKGVRRAPPGTAASETDPAFTSRVAEALRSRLLPTSRRCRLLPVRSTPCGGRSSDVGTCLKEPGKPATWWSRSRGNERRRHAAFGGHSRCWTMLSQSAFSGDCG